MNTELWRWIQDNNYELPTGYALDQLTAELMMNIGNPDEYTLLQLANAVIEASGAESSVTFEPLPTDDPQVRQPNIDRARELLGWQPTVSLSDGLRKTIDQSGRDRLIGKTS